MMNFVPCHAKCTSQCEGVKREYRQPPGMTNQNQPNISAHVQTGHEKSTLFFQEILSIKKKLLHLFLTNLTHFIPDQGEANVF